MTKTKTMPNCPNCNSTQLKESKLFATLTAMKVFFMGVIGMQDANEYWKRKYKCRNCGHTFEKDMLKTRG